MSLSLNLHLVVPVALALGVVGSLLLRGKPPRDVYAVPFVATPPQIELRVRPRDVQRCAFCHDAAQRHETVLCLQCGTALHEECWALSRRGCVTVGCASRGAA